MITLSVPSPLAAEYLGPEGFKAGQILADKAGGRQVNRSKGDGEEYGKWLEIKYFLVFGYPEESELVPSWAAELARQRQDEVNGFN